MRKTLIGLVLTVCICFVLVGCNTGSSADRDQQAATASALTEAHARIGMPAINNFQERKLAKMIFELRDQEDLICYAYIVNLQGELIFIGKCMGFGLPYSVQYTNPKKIVDRFGRPVDAMHEGYIIPQADPNGLFMPDGLSATWLMMIDKKGVARPVYIEPQIIVSPFPLHN